MDQWLLAVTSDPAAKGSAKDLEVAGAGPVHCRFSIPPSFLTMCSSERCLLRDYISTSWYISLQIYMVHSMPPGGIVSGCMTQSTYNGTLNCTNI